MKGPGMGTFGKCKGGGRRSAPRTKAPLIAIVTTLKGSHSAIVVDISSTGARLRGTDLPIAGEDMFVTIEQIIAFGTVAWARDGELGLAFDQPLSPGDEKLLRRNASVFAGMSADLRAAFDDWTRGVAR